MTHVAFENLDVFARRGVETDTTWSVAKIVGRGRGGWCFELNGAFSELLMTLGFEVRRLGAIVQGETPAPSPDHLTVEVRLDVPYLVDVGFGDSFIKPLRLDTAAPQDGGSGTYQLDGDGDAVTLYEIDADGARDPQYRFGREPHRLADFDATSQRLQTEPGLQWTAGAFATRLLDGGPDRVTLLPGRIKFRRDGKWSEQAVPAAGWDAELERWFGMRP